MPEPEVQHDLTPSGPDRGRGPREGHDAPGEARAAGEPDTAMDPETMLQALRPIVSRAARGESRAHRLQTTDLVHRVYERLVLTAEGNGQADRALMGRAVRTVRAVLVDEARRRRAVKRGGTHAVIPLDRAAEPAALPPDDQLALDDELNRLAVEHPRAAEVVSLTLFAGLSQARIAELMGVSERTVRRDWDVARVWLYQRLCAHRESRER